MNMKRIMTLVLALAMCIVALGAMADGEKTTVTIWSKDRHDADYVQKKIDEYNATNTDNIEVVYQLYTDNYIQAVDMAIQNGELPDVLVYQEQVFGKYYLTGQYADLNQFLTDEDKAYFADVIIDGYNQIDGKLYFVPTTGTTCRLFYNKEIFERVGITEPPKTLEQVVEYAKKITAELGDEGIYGFAQNMKSASSALNRSLMIGMEREAGLVYGFDFAKGEYDFMPYAESLRLWTELLSDECAFPGCESLDIDPLRTQFAQGKIGMYFCYVHSESGVYTNQFPMDSEKWDCCPIPTVGGVEVGKQYYSGTSSYLLNAQSPNLEAAAKAYKAIFTNEDYLVGYYEGGYGVTLLPSVREKAHPGYNKYPEPLVTKENSTWRAYTAWEMRNQIDAGIKAIPPFDYYVPYDLNGTNAEFLTDDATTLIKEAMEKALVGELTEEQWYETVETAWEIDGQIRSAVWTEQYNNFVNAE